jgi:hypothetical protein
MSASISRVRSLNIWVVISVWASARTTGHPTRGIASAVIVFAMRRVNTAGTNAVGIIELLGGEEGLGSITSQHTREPRGRLVGLLASAAFVFRRVVSAGLTDSRAGAAVAVGRVSATTTVVVVRARGIGGGCTGLETVLAHADCFCVVFESSHAFGITPEVDESPYSATLALAHSKSTGAVGVESWVVDGMASVATWACHMQGILISDGVWWHASLRRLLIVLKRVW